MAGLLWWLAGDLPGWMADGASSGPGDAPCASGRRRWSISGPLWPRAALSPSGYAGVAAAPSRHIPAVPILAAFDGHGAYGTHPRTAGLRPHHQGCVLTIGTYDGLHLGHQALSSATRARPAARPAGDDADVRADAARIPVRRDGPAGAADVAARALARAAADGSEHLCCLRFDEGCGTVTGAAFARLLADELACRSVVVGHDFRFGRNGAATARMLREAGDCSASRSRWCRR